MIGYKRLIKVLSIVSIICIIICIFPWRKNIDTTINGVQWKIGDSEYSENVSITMNGTYSRYFMKNNRFKGKISIDIYDFTQSSLPVDLEFEDGTATLTYIQKDDFFDVNSFGFLVCSQDFNNLLIGVHSPVESDAKGWSGEDGTVISAPAQNRKQGLELAEILSNNIKWLSTDINYWK